MANDLEDDLDRYADILCMRDDPDAYWDRFSRQPEQGLKTAITMYNALDRLHRDILADIEPESYIAADADSVSKETYFDVFRDAFEDTTGMTPGTYTERRKHLQDRARTVVEHYVDQYMTARIGTDDWRNRPDAVQTVVTEDMSDIERKALFFVDDDYTRR